MIPEESNAPENILDQADPETGKAWRCLYARPRHEKSLARVCIREQIPFYLPLRRAVRVYRSGRKERWLPLFPGYLFCVSDAEQRYKLRGEKNLLSLFDVEQPEKLVTELRQIRTALEASRELESVPYVTEGQRVRVTTGPFRGVEGIVVKVKKNWKVHLNVNTLNQSVPLEIDAGCIEPVSD